MKVVEGDITDLKLLSDNDIGAIVHGANIRSTMGAGLALQIRRKFPEAFYADQDFEKTPEQRLGDFSCAEVTYIPEGDIYSKKLVIANLYQQDLYPPVLQPAMLEKSLTKFSNLVKQPIAVPWGIGCGLAMGDWDEVKPMVENILKDSTAIWVKFDEA